MAKYLDETGAEQLNQLLAAKFNTKADKTEIPTKTSELTNDSGFGTYSKPTGGIPKADLSSDVQTSLGLADTALQGMTILSYGSSTWNDFIAAYNNKSVVYCRASSNSNPATGSQTRLAFMAYVNNAENPTEVEFQYYRSVNTHSDSQQGDQVYVYKLNSSGTWTVTLRNAFSKVVAGTNMSSSYLNGVITLEATDTTYESKTAASGGTDVSLVTTGEKYTWNNKGNGTITKVQANGTDVASSGTANIPAASTSAYGVTKLSNATDSTSEVLAATPKAVKAAYDLAAGKGTGTITGVSVNGTSVATSGVANITSVPASILSGAIPSAVTATTQSASDNSTKIATTAFVQTAIDNLPEPMVFKGSLGTGGTITALPTNGTANIGDTYKVITAGTYASQTAKIGDTFICLTKTSSANTWELIPSGDEPSGTVTSITIKATSPIAIDNTGTITTSGTRTLSHATSGVTTGTYRSVTVNNTGHVTAGTNPTTISGYGITDAKIANGTITLGSNTITPLTSSSTLNAAKVSGTLPTNTYTDTKNTAGSTDTSNKIYLIGAESQAANPQTYSDNEVFAQDGVLNAQEITIGARKSGSTIGTNSATFGNTNIASGENSHAEGVLTTASGNDSHTEGGYTTASAYYSHAEGHRSYAGEYCSHAEGYFTVANNTAAHAENGNGLQRPITITGDANATTYITTNTKSAKVGQYLKYQNEVRKITALVANTSITVETTFSNSQITSQTAYLMSTTASGQSSHAEGRDTLASGACSHAEGSDTQATNDSSHAEGTNTTASGLYSHAEGEYTTASSGTAPHAEGSHTTATGTASHAEGSYTNITGSYGHGEGQGTKSTNRSQHVQGEYNIHDNSGNNINRGTYAHIVGNGTTDNARSNAHTLDWSGNAWFAGDVYVGSTGGKNKDSGSKKLATEDYVTTSISGKEDSSNKVTSLSSGSTNTQYPSARCVYQALSQNGIGIITSNTNLWELDEGVYRTNVSLEDYGINLYYNSEDYITIHDGTEAVLFVSKPPNIAIREVIMMTAGGYLYSIQAKASGGESYDVFDEFEMWENKVTSISSSSTDYEYPSAKLLYDQLALKQNTLTQGTNITISGNTISATDTKNTAGSTDSSSKLYLIGATSQAANPQTYSDNEVFVKDGVLNAQELTIGFRDGSNSTIGANSVVIGTNNIASGEGSCAEGILTTASGYNSHAEGGQTTASASYSHAEGFSSVAGGNWSHAEGCFTTAQRKSQHTEGEYNILDNSGTTSTRGTYVHIVGNGTSSGTRSNAHTLAWDGTAWFAGDVYVGSTSGTNKDAGSKKLITVDDIPVYTATEIETIWYNGETPSQILGGEY